MEYGKRVMIVEDDKHLGSALQSALSSFNFEVRLCENGTEALLCVMSEEFDYIVTDYNMPGMDGLELTKRLRKKIAPRTVLIGMSGEDRGMDFLNTGANDFLLKPFHPARLAMLMVRDDVLSGGKQRASAGES